MVGIREVGRSRDNRVKGGSIGPRVEGGSIGPGVEGGMLVGSWMDGGDRGETAGVTNMGKEIHIGELLREYYFPIYKDFMVKLLVQKTVAGFVIRFLSST